jgi:aldehyde:ferredoxin oxidoreductase
MGAVMGSKYLKAIAVAGKNKVPVADPVAYASLRSDANRALRTDPETLVVHELGTASIAEYMDYLGLMPKRYYQSDVFEGAGNISGSRITETILVGTHACHACVIACGRVVRLEDGEKRKGPEYETLIGFGPNLWLDDPAFATRMGELCDRFGIDTISLSNTVGLAFKLYEKGLITERDTGGLKLKWGDPTAVEKLVTLACHRHGFGEYLLVGARTLGRRFGAEDEAVQVNGLEVPYHDPRGGSGMALSYATSPRGACHNQSDYFMVEIGQAEASLGMKYLSRHAGAEKAESVAIHQNWRSLFNSLVLCFFANVSPESLLSLINAACGENYDVDEILCVGERGWNLKRAINVRLGLRAENDRLPKEFMHPHLPGGGTEGYTPPFNEMLAAYYESRGWDPDTGMPTVDKLSSLGLEFVVEGLNLGRNQ